MIMTLIIVLYQWVSLKNGYRAPKNVGTCEHNSMEPPFHQKLYYLKYRKGGGGVKKNFAFI